MGIYSLATMFTYGRGVRTVVCVANAPNVAIENMLPDNMAKTTWFNLPAQIDNILAALARVKTQEMQEMDILDTVLADMAQLTTDANAILQELSQVQSGNIPVTDPRFQQLVSTITQLDTAMKAQLPKPTP